MNTSQSTTNPNRYQQLVEQIENSPTIRGQYYLELVQIVTNSSSIFNPTMLKLESVIGSELFDKLGQLETEWPNSQIHQKIYENNVTINEMETWITQHEIARKSYEERILLLEQWINQQEVNTSKPSPEIILAFEKKILDNHQWSLTTIDGTHAIRLYNDGEINTTKAGHCYGWRSVFKIRPALINYPVLTFPVQSGKFSYVVLQTEQLALQLREEMSNLIYK